MAEEEVPNPGRRKFLQDALKVGVGLAVGSRLTKDILLPTSDEQPTEEQVKKQKALRDLNTFMEDYTNDKTVSNFLADSSPEDINKAFKLVKEDSLYYASDVNSWNLTVPLESGDTIVSYRTKEMNPNEGSGDFVSVRVYLDKEGKVTTTPSSEVPETLDETKQAISQFTSRPLVVDSDWREEQALHDFVAGPRPIENGKEVVVSMHGKGLTSITIRDVSNTSGDSKIEI